MLHLGALRGIAVDVVAKQEQDLGFRVTDRVPHALVLGRVAGAAAEGKPQGEPAAGRLDGSEGSGGFRFCAVDTEPVVVARSLLQAGDLQHGGEIIGFLRASLHTGKGRGEIAFQRDDDLEVGLAGGANPDLHTLVGDAAEHGAVDRGGAVDGEQLFVDRCFSQRLEACPGSADDPSRRQPVVDGSLESLGGLLKLPQFRQGDREHVVSLCIFRGLLEEGSQ